MTIKALNFIKINMGITDPVFQGLRKISEVKEIFFITSKYDFSILIEASSSEEIDRLFTK